MNDAGEESVGGGRGASSTHAERMELIGEPREPETYVMHRGPSIWFGWAAAATCAGIAALGWYQVSQIGGERTRYAESLESITSDYEALAARAQSLDEMLEFAKSSLAVTETALASLGVERESLSKRLVIAEDSRGDLELRLAATTATLTEARGLIEDQTRRVVAFEAELKQATEQAARFSDGLSQDELRTSRAALLGDAGTVTFAWGSWDEPEIEGVSGDVVWNNKIQRGFARFVGLPVNDPGVQQYQLWLVGEHGMTYEDGRSARVSGGVFDVGAGDVDPDTGDIIVPIRLGPGQRIDDAAVFAVTVERPGGEAVSDLSRRVVITRVE